MLIHLLHHHSKIVTPLYKDLENIVKLVEHPAIKANLKFRVGLYRPLIIVINTRSKKINFEFKKRVRIAIKSKETSSLLAILQTAIIHHPVLPIAL